MDFSGAAPGAFLCNFGYLVSPALFCSNFALLTCLVLNGLNFVYYIVKYNIFVTVIARGGRRNVTVLNFQFQQCNQNQSFMKKLNKKGREIVVGILIAVSSFVAGIVSVKNPAAGELIEKVTTVIATGLVQVPADTIPATF